MAEEKPSICRWHPPAGIANGGAGATAAAGNLTGLRVNNSLCNEKVPFVAQKGNQVSWYMCGPTVYDSSHVGHARTYLSFDIIRRILEDYFGYEVFCVMNVTDIDDKIIIRARRNHLLAKYCDSNDDVEKVMADVTSAIDKAEAKQQSKVEASEGAVEKAGTEKQKEELKMQVEQERLKLTQIQSLRGQSAAVREEAAKLDGRRAVERVVAWGGDYLGQVLDEKEGSTVTDHSIFRAHAMRFEREFFEDMAALNVRPPHVITRVSEYMDSITSYVAGIQKAGLAYASNGSVYFDTAAFRAAGHTYGKLCPWAVGSAELAAESEADFETKEKKSKNDFALWKASKPGEPCWASEWGQGRPGWHIECSAMASDILGDCIDIHCGGMDLRFPHHDNELAQAEAFYGHHQWVAYFLHTGHLHIEGLKMSKSLKNFITIRQALARNSARQFRLLFILQSWDKPMNFGESAMAEAVSREKQLRNFFQNLQAAVKEAGSEGEESWGGLEKELNRATEKGESEVRLRLQDNFDTPGAMTAVMEVVSATNVYLAKAAAERRRPRPHLLLKATKFVRRILRIFGLVEGSDESLEFSSGERSSGGGQSADEAVRPYAEALSSLRDQVRAAAVAGASKDSILTLTDRVRDYMMVDLGIRCEDRPGGAAVVKFDDPEVLRSERDEKIKKAAADALQKLHNKKATKEKELEKWKLASLEPSSMFKKEAAKYGAFDDSGLPTHDASGKELSGKARKNVEKEYKKAKDAYDKFVEKISSSPTFLEDLQKEVLDLDAQIAKLS